jgi:hypothetical protein
MAAQVKEGVRVATYLSAQLRKLYSGVYDILISQCRSLQNKHSKNLSARRHKTSLH